MANKPPRAIQETVYYKKSFQDQDTQAFYGHLGYLWKGEIGLIFFKFCGVLRNADMYFNIWKILRSARLSSAGFNHNLDLPLTKSKSLKIAVKNPTNNKIPHQITPTKQTKKPQTKHNLSFKCVHIIMGFVL